ncbi:MAG: hydroxyacid dehydrogenase [Gemmatimonadetes bacterium]|jgi:phosphoglycerate dehydrogenase-like enzyme|nr:hydroxyacid dehydrogenase [Gemmatimonadota bacterium]
MKKGAFFCNNQGNLDSVYGKGRKERVAEIVDLYPETITGENFSTHAEGLRNLEVVFSTWGMLQLEKSELEQLPALEAVFYGAGSVKGFAEPLLEQGITLMSAWGANAVPVAEFTLAQTLLACKGYFRNTRECGSPQIRRSGRPFRGKGVFTETVGLIGIGMIGSLVCELLKPFELEVIVHDPYLSDEKAGELGVEKVDLEELFSRSYVISNHLPNIPATRGMLDGELFASMREDAAFINTGRGAQVVEGDLIGVLEKRADLTALLDVTFPEPPEEDSAFYTLPNVQLSSHIAGSMNDEVVRMADYAIEEFLRWEQGEALKYQVTLEMLETMA